MFTWRASFREITQPLKLIEIYVDKIELDGFAGTVDQFKIWPLLLQVGGRGENFQEWQKIFSNNICQRHVGQNLIPRTSFGAERIKTFKKMLTRLSRSFKPTRSRNAPNQIFGFEIFYLLKNNFLEKISVFWPDTSKRPSDVSGVEKSR